VKDIKEYVRQLVCDGLDSYGSDYKPVANSCEHDNEILVSVKAGESLF
jgi:hypothetical protein